MDQPRVIIAVVFSLAILMVYPYILRHFYPDMDKEPTEVTTVVDQKEVAPVVAAAKQAAVREAAPAVVIPTEEELVTVETPLYRATFSSIGGGIKSWVLKGYRTELDSESAKIDIVPQTGQNYSFTTAIAHKGGNAALNFLPSVKAVTISSDQDGALSFVWVSPEGLRIEKQYTFSGSGYMVSGEILVSNGTGQPVNTKVTTDLALYSPTQESEIPGYSYHSGTVIYDDDNIERLDEDEAKDGYKGTPQWIGLEDKYFLTTLLPKGDEKIEWSSGAVAEGEIRGSLAFPVALSPAGSTTFQYRAYIGPKEYNRLKAHNLHIEESVEFGMFAFLARPMLVALNFFFRYLGNYGIAIILLTVVIKVIFYPLSKHGLKSMKDMQKLQPQMAALKQRYKDDKQRMNKELMELYKRHKINPLGGCLPMILQIPVFIALYEVLYVALELRHAPFMLWITDLSAPDTLMVLPEALPMLGGSAFGPLPLLMGASMFIQQKMTPTAMDPAQAKMMMFMPIIFTFMFLNFPTGLVLYWLVNNVLQIGQQYYIQKTTH
ncbi:MAG: membrane protein insertase YidC [Deltaproteobacteria bacterium]|nr:membrane protein insertase YidC [Deltaproteobacteria bacterium]